MTDCLEWSAPLPASTASGRQTVTDEELKVEDYEIVLSDHRRLVRELDVAMHGEEGAAQQASLCDLIEPARNLAREVLRLREENERLREALIWCSGSPDFNEGGQAREGWQRLCAPLLAALAQGEGE